MAKIAGDHGALVSLFYFVQPDNNPAIPRLIFGNGIAISAAVGELGMRIGVPRSVKLLCRKALIKEKMYYCSGASS